MRLVNFYFFKKIIIQNKFTQALATCIYNVGEGKKRDDKRHSGNISADEVFKNTDKKYGEAGVLLRGLRSRENLSQIEFAKIINVFLRLF